MNADTPATIRSLNVGLPGAANSAILDAPIVDADNGTVFAVSSNDGTSAVIVQADTATLAQLSKGRIGRGSIGGTSVDLYDGAFNNNYFNNPSSGALFLCGTAAGDTTPRSYFFRFTGRIMHTTPSSSAQILNSTTSRCSPISEFFNPNIGATGTDFFFWGMTSDCVGSAGCVMSRNSAEPSGTSVIIVDNISNAGQASSIYFTPQGSPRRAVKLTQNGLQ